MLQKSTIQLLRFHFSFFLLPVYLFALSQAPDIHLKNALLSFAILHLLVYPASNGYNSFMDRDNTPIGGLRRPLAPTRQLFYLTVIMDAIAIILSLLITPYFALGILLYIMASRAYSYRRIRLKQYPLIGFITVFIFQGALVFFITAHGVQSQHSLDIPVIPCIISSLLIGSLYPLTQIYQHEADLNDGVTSMSYYLGLRGTFIFSGILFLTATCLLLLLFRQQMNFFYLYLFIMFPVVLFFLYWGNKVWRDQEAASFRNSLWMNVLSTVCTTVFFITLIALNH